MNAAAMPGRAAILLALAALVLTGAANAHHLAWWGLPVLLLGCGVQLRAVLAGGAGAGRAAVSSRLARGALVVLITAGVLLSFRTLNGLAAGATLLVAMSAAKLLEARTARDWFVIAGATLFLLLAACLDRQQLWRLPWYALCLWLSAAALRGLAGGAPLSAAVLLRGAGRQLLYAAPLTAVLFVFFPRLPGAFWALPGGDEAVTGLGDEMSPGNIARLVESDEPALRARFSGALPPPSERYWRGPVLHDFDGYTWRRHRGALPPATAAAPGLDYRGPEYRYSATLEPNTHGIVVALERARPPESPLVYFSEDYQLVARRPLTQPQSFELSGWPQAASVGELSALARRVDTALPPERNPRARALAQALRAQSPDDAAFVARVLDYLRTGGYEYTLTPQRLGREAVDELLFGTRQGFCGHYASAFVDLMRAGGVPARVVTGYQGGEWNPIGHYLAVRQSDAHAWAEVWLPGRGWLRADPTAVVAPERLTRGGLSYGAGLGSRAGGLMREAPWLAGLLQGWEAANAWWQDEVVNFNYARQLQVAGWLGFGDGDWRTLAIALGAGLAAWLAWIAWSLSTLARAARPDALARAWRGIDRRLARAGHARAPHEGVLAYGERLAHGHPAAAAALAPLARRYVALRFGPGPDDESVREFARAARRFRVPALAAPGRTE